MLKPNRKIPKVAAAALVVGGCGGGSSTPAERLARDICEDMLGCDPTTFNASYSSLAECQNYTTDYVNYLIDEYTAAYGADCANAVLDAYQCYYSTLDAPACDYYAAYDNCYNLIVDAYYACY